MNFVRCTRKTKGFYHLRKSWLAISYSGTLLISQLNRLLILTLAVKRAGNFFRSASSSSVATRVAAEQAQVRIRIWEMERKEMEGLQNELKVMAIVEDNDMAVDTELSVNGVNGTWGSEGGTVNGNGVGQKNVFVSARAQTKQRALAAWVCYTHWLATQISLTNTIPYRREIFQSSPRQKQSLSKKPSNSRNNHLHKRRNAGTAYRRRRTNGVLSGRRESSP